MPDNTVPYGAWSSPISPAMVARSGVSFGGIALADDAVWWLERRPEEGGRGVVCRSAPGSDPEDVTGDDVDVRTLVHEYGGGDFVVSGDAVWYADFEDQRVYRTRPGEDREAVTPDPDLERGLRYADFELSPDGERVYCVRERHFEDDREPENAVVTFPADGSDDPTVVAEGRDFYASPRVSPDGSRLAWISWDHPHMPWDQTHLHVAEVTADGDLTDETVVMGDGSDPESVIQPQWSPRGDLHAISDRTDYWNVFEVDVETGDQVNRCPRQVEFGVPPWLFGFSTYAFLDDGRIATIYTDQGERNLGFIDDRELVEAGDEYDVYDSHLVTDGENLLFVGGRPDLPKRLVHRSPDDVEAVVRRSSEVDVDPEYVSRPEHVSFPTDDRDFQAHGFFYPPTNPDVSAPDDELPPVVVTVHGGPTSQTHPVYDLGVQFFTSRGIAVMDVNYRGSTGYGREYRDRLKGEWGVADTIDCVRAAEYLASAGHVDPDRQAIRGGSAGGYATLCGLAFHEAFDAGVSYYGVSDVSALAEHTHKFESRYLDGLIGPYPEESALYEERSPVHHADGIRSPVLLLQGEDDPVVPPAQAESMIDELEANGIPYAYVEFEDEQHGFRKAESIERATEAELSFLGQVFDFDPDDDVEPVHLVTE